MDFLIYYETVPREYENACLLKCELERRGYSVKICNTIRRDYWKSKYYSPKVIIALGVYSEHGINMWANQNKASICTKIVDLQYEQVVFENKEGKPRNLPTGKAKDTYHICWGEARADKLEKFGIDRKYLVKIGPIQLDLVRSEFKSYYLSREDIGREFNIDPNKKWILFASNLAFGVMSKEAIEAYAKRSKSFVNAFELSEYARKVVKLLVEWLDEFLSDHTDICYIYRPHPSEMVSDAFDLLMKKHSNFYIIRDYSVKQWFQVVDIVNIWNSTSIVECYYCEKPCCVIDIPDEEKYHKYRIPLIDNNKVIRNYKDFEYFNTESRFYEEENFPMLMEEYQYYYGYKGEYPVYYVLCDFLEKVFKEDSYFELYKFEITDKMREAVYAFRKMTLRGDIMLKFFPLINIILKKKCKIDQMLNQHNTKDLKNTEERIRKQVLRVSKDIENTKKMDRAYK